MTQAIPPGDDASPSATLPPGSGSLTLAIRRARFDDAERSGARAELRAARLGRLEMLQDALQPLLTQVPADIDMFDVALVPSSDPRLFIDMIGFVEMGRDARIYRLQQDTRHGRIRVAESESLETMVGAVTDYVARRLLERDKALAADARDEVGTRVTIAAPAASPRSNGDEDAKVSRQRGMWSLRWVAIAFAFLIDLLGAIAFFTILGAAGWYLWNRTHGM